MSPSDEIIHKVLDGLATKEEAEQVAQWLSTEEGQLYLTKSMDRKFFDFKEGLEELYILRNIPSENIWEKINKRTFYKKRYSLLLRAAMIVIPFIIIAGIALTIFSNSRHTSMEYSELSTNKGERSQITLSDGTQIILNADTRLLYPKEFNKSCRNVKLAGEAYFNVTANKKRPFTITLTNEVTIEVLGTSFNTKAYKEDNNIEIALDEGKINLISSGEEHQLLPQEKLIYTKNTAEIKISKNEDTQSASGWKNDIIAFNNTPLPDVIKTLNRQYNIEFKVEDKDALKYSYTLTAKKESIGKILTDLEKISPVLFTLKNDTVNIWIK